QTTMASPATDPEFGLRHQLNAAQMTMVAVGGSIGTGLLLGTAAAIDLAGPAVILTFVLAAFICWTVALALGELASTHPAAGSFGVYGDLYLNAWAGFISRAGYWASLAVSIGAELVASATYMQLWFPHVRAIVWVLIFSVFLLSTNLLSVRSYGRFEFWFAMIKVAVITAFIVLGSVLLLGGRATPQYTTQGGFFPLGPAAPLLALTFAIYTFGGVEFVAVTAGESSSAPEVSRAVRMTFLALTFLYLGAALRALRLAWRLALAAHLSFRRGLTSAEGAALPVRSPLRRGGSVVGLIVVLASVAKTWWDSRVNLISGLAMLIGLPVLYFLLRPKKPSARPALQ